MSTIKSFGLRNVRNHIGEEYLLPEYRHTESDWVDAFNAIVYPLRNNPNAELTREQWVDITHHLADDWALLADMLVKVRAGFGYTEDTNIVDSATPTPVVEDSPEVSYERAMKLIGRP